MGKIKAAVFGTGFMGKVHTEAIRRLGSVEVTAIAASNQLTADKFASSHNIPEASADWRAVLANEKIDAVHICTPNTDNDIGRGPGAGRFG
jgi:predicted dehydrogenase